MKIPKPILALKALIQIILSVCGTLMLFPFLILMGIINVSVDKFNKWKRPKK